MRRCLEKQKRLKKGGEIWDKGRTEGNREAKRNNSSWQDGMNEEWRTAGRKAKGEKRTKR